MTAVRRKLATLLPSALAASVALLVTSLLIRLYGASPREVYHLFFVGTLANGYGVGQLLFKATPLVLSGLSVAVAFHAGLFNVGADGQAAAGAFAAGLLGASLPPSTSAYLALPLCFAAAFGGGALVGAVPGFLKATRGAHEVVVTIMLNFVVLGVLSDVGKRFYLHESVHTPVIAPGAVLGRASAIFPSLHGSALNGAALLALGSVAATAAWLGRTRGGFRLRAVGLGAEAARSAGIAVSRETVKAMALAGGLAGLCGVNFVMGFKHYYEEGCTSGVGFMGIVVALLGRGRALGIVLAALLFGALSQGCLVVNALVAKEIVDVLMAVILLAVAAASAVTHFSTEKR